MHSIGRTIKELRKLKGYSQSNRNEPRGSTLQLISDALGVDVMQWSYHDSLVIHSKQKSSKAKTNWSKLLALIVIAYAVFTFLATLIIGRINKEPWAFIENWF